MKSILAIDQSTSATKAIVFDLRGKLLDSETIEHRQIYPKPGWVEHDAGEIWSNTLKAVKAVAFRNGSAKLQYLSITNQRETVVVFDRKTGKPLCNAMVWQCRRGEQMCADLSAAGYGEYVRQRTGLRIDPYFSASKLAWLATERPEIAARIRNGEAVIGTIDAYLLHRMTGGKSFVTDHTNASRTLLYNIHRCRWDEQLCELFKVPQSALPEIIDCSQEAGATDVGGALPAQVPICGVMGDSQASLFGQRCFKPGTIKVTFGTGSSLLLNTGDDCGVFVDGAVNTPAWVIGAKPTYAIEGIINFSAATLAWLKQQINMIESVEESEALAESVSDNGGVYLVPAFAGLSAPYWSAGARGAIVGLTTASTRAHVVRAALESISYQIRDVVDMMRNAGVALSSIHADGGPTANRFLMQFTADITGLEIVAARVKNISPLGAAMCGALGMGVSASLDELESWPFETERYKPSMTPETVSALYEGWKTAVRRVL